jgi:hypothetical protein
VFWTKGWWKKGEDCSEFNFSGLELEKKKLKRERER